MAKKKVTKKKDPAKAWDNWFDEHVELSEQHSER